MQLIKLYVDHLTCASCVQVITEALMPLDGVQDIRVMLDEGRVEVDREFNRFQDLIAAIKVAGYSASLDLGGISPYKRNDGGNSCCCG